MELVMTPALSLVVPQSPSSPAEADAYVRQRRPQISERWRTAPVICMAEEASSIAPEAPRVVGVGSRAEFRSSRAASGMVWAVQFSGRFRAGRRHASTGTLAWARPGVRQNQKAALVQT